MRIGVDGVPGNSDAKKKAFKEAQAAVGELPEFRGNVKVVATDLYWDWTADAAYKKGWREHLDEWNAVGSDWPFHYLGSVKTYSEIGRAFGEAMIELCE